jgi:hypothetical protein
MYGGKIKIFEFVSVRGAFSNDIDTTSDSYRIYYRR